VAQVDTKVAQVDTKVTPLDSKIGQLDSKVNELNRLNSAVGQLREEISLLKVCKLRSLIVPHFPALFQEFRAKRFNLLWRGSRDGFTANEFHRRCDGRANTLTLIADTDGNIFGGFTPVKWDSNSYNKGDDSLQSFLFTLRNPHGVLPRKFALRAEKKQHAIYCNSAYCAAFGSGRDIGVTDNCNANRDCYTRIGTRWSNSTYANDTAFKYVFTCAYKFTVKEIEVFEIAD
jgi:hypothetical protein